MSGYRMESGEDLVKFKQNRTAVFPSSAWCLEASWEVANKQGGIYTVLRSKAAVSCKEHGNKYIMMGPLKPNHVHEVEVCNPPADSPLSRAVNKLREKGWNVLFGNWLVEGNPQVVLFDIGSASHLLNSWKQELYESTFIGIPHLDIECNDTVILGFMMAQFAAEFKYQLTQEPAPQGQEPSSDTAKGIIEKQIEEKMILIYENMAAITKMANSAGIQGTEPQWPQVAEPTVASAMVVVHVHEWMAGVALIMLRMWKVDVATVFTTHATMLGRHLCAGALDFYNYLPSFNVDVEAGKRKIYHRYCIERAAASLAHTFTTVSEITGDEALHLIKRRPDVITPNGLNVKRMSHEFQNLHQIYKEKIKKFIHGHFYGHLDFDLDKTLFTFIAGRYEFGNKGGDIFIEALARLNHYLKACGSDVTVVAFIIFPAKNTSFNVESLKGHAITKSLQETIEEIQVQVGKRMYESCSRGEAPDPKSLLTGDDLVKLKRVVYASQRRENWPPITTHNLVDPEDDLVLKTLNRCSLLNAPTDRVKVIFHPDFLNSDNPLLGLNYEEFIRGCHLGCFPSYYEPWGYTPAECTVMGIPSITSNLSGFGCFIQEHVSDPQAYGIYIVDRKFISVEESVKKLAQTLFDFSQMTRRQRILQRNRTERLSDLLDWKKLHKYYTESRVSALCRAYPEWEPECVAESVGSCLYRFPRPASSYANSDRQRPDQSIDLDAEDQAEDQEEDRELEDVLDNLDLEDERTVGVAAS